MSFFFHLAAPFSLKLCENLGFRFQMFLCVFAIGCSHFFALSFGSFYAFIFFYAFLFSFSSGLTYLLPLYNAYKYFPMRRGLVSGFIVGAYGFGSMISSPLLMVFLNQNNEKPIFDPIDNNYYFSRDICENLSHSLCMLGVFYIVLAMIGIFLCIEYEEYEENQESSCDSPKENLKDLVVELIENIEKESENEEKMVKKSVYGSAKLSKLSNLSKRIRNLSIFGSQIENWPLKTVNPEDEIHCNSLMQALKSPLFYYLLSMLTFSSCGGVFLAANYKNLGILTIPNDGFLNLVGSVGAVCNGGGRVLWGYIMDKYQFHRTFLLLLILAIIEGITLRFILQFQWVYLVWVGIAFFCLGGHPVIFPTFCIKSFGAKIGAEIYGVLFWGMCLGNWLQAGVVLGLKRNVGFENLGFLFALGGVACLGIVFLAKLRL